MLWWEGEGSKSFLAGKEDTFVFISISKDGMQPSAVYTWLDFSKMKFPFRIYNNSPGYFFMSQASLISALLYKTI